MPAARAFAGVYEMMDFPAYQFREYPKAVQVEADGKIEDRIVQNEAEEAELLETLTTAASETETTEEPSGRRGRRS